MSKTEIYIIRKRSNSDGTETYPLEFYKDVPNGKLSAPAIWSAIERWHLPSFEGLEFIDSSNGYMSRQIATMCGKSLPDGSSPMQEIWDLWDSPELTIEEHICLSSTFDNVYIPIGRLMTVADAYENVWFSNENLKGQASVFEEVSLLAEKQPDIFGVFVNQSSVSSVTDCECVVKKDRYVSLSDEDDVDEELVLNLEKADDAIGDLVRNHII